MEGWLSVGNALHYAGREAEVLVDLEGDLGRAGHNSLRHLPLGTLWIGS